MPMRLDELLKSYRNEWLLIEVHKFDEDYNVVDGNVLVHSPIKEDIYKALLRVKSENVAIEYAREVPDNFAVML